MTITGPMPLPRIVGGANDILVDADGHRCIDLFSGHGTVWLGHATPRIAAALHQRVEIRFVPEDANHARI